MVLWIAMVLGLLVIDAACILPFLPENFRRKMLVAIALSGSRS